MLCLHIFTFRELQFGQSSITEFTDASNVTDNTGISKHRLSPYTAYYLKWLTIK